MVARQVTRSSQKEETRLHGAPAVLDGSPAVQDQVRKKTTHSSSLSTPKRLTFPQSNGAHLRLHDLPQLSVAWMMVSLLPCLCELWLGP